MNRQRLMRLTLDGDTDAAAQLWRLLRREGVVPVDFKTTPLSEIDLVEYNNVRAELGPELSSIFGIEEWPGYLVEYTNREYPRAGDEWGVPDYDNPNVSNGNVGFSTIGEMVRLALAYSAYEAGHLEDNKLVLISETETHHDDEYDFDITYTISRSDGNQITDDELRYLFERIWMQIAYADRFDDGLDDYIRKAQAKWEGERHG